MHFMRAVTRIAVVMLAGLASPVMAQEPAAPTVQTALEPDAIRLLEVMLPTDMLEVMRQEGITHARAFSSDILDPGAVDRLMGQVDRIYDMDTMRDTMRDAFQSGLDAESVQAALRYFETPFGARMLALETSARIAISDPEIEAIARDSYLEMLGHTTPHLISVQRFIDANALVERNTAGSLSAIYQLYAGLIESGYLRMSEDEILAEIWARRDALEQDTTDWLHALLLMAFRPVASTDVDRYTAFFETPAGKALNTALFDGFERLSDQGAYLLGLAIGDLASERDL